MTQANPLLHPDGLPAFSQIRAEHIEPAVDAVLDEYRRRLDALVAAGGDFDTLMGGWQQLDQMLERVWAPVGHLHGVADSPQLRSAYAAALEKVTALGSEVGQNRALYEAVEKIAAAPDFADLPQAARTLVEHAQRDFRLSGVALEESQRSRFRDISNELAQLAAQFEEAVLDATQAWTEHLDDAAQLEGIPESGRAVLKGSAREAGKDGWLVTLHQPSVQAVLTYANDRALRERVWTAYNTRASDQGPHAGRFDNSQRIEQIMVLRHEAATLLGYASAAQWLLATKMAGSVDVVEDFLADLVARARPLAERELTTLREFAAQELGLDDLQPWDVAFAAEQLRERHFSISEEELKPYFAVDAVLAGLFGIVEQLFGVRLRQREGVDTWHGDVRFLEVIDAGGAVIAGVYVDLFARSGKRGGAWMDVCASRSRVAGDTQQPVAFVTCNFAPPTDGVPALLTHDDVITLFHEFGHGLHHLLTRIDFPGIAGIDGVEWDAVELPSQFMENFAWEREALDLFARDWQSGQALPDELYQRMVAARHFHAGLFLVRQLEFALFDMQLHAQFDPARGSRVQQVLQQAREQTAVLPVPSWQRFAHGFAHIFGGGYAAGYYSYLWAERLSADVFARFQERGVLDADSGARFRDEILAVGGSRPALESFVAFRGREPDSAALLRSYGLEDSTAA